MKFVTFVDKIFNKSGSARTRLKKRKVESEGVLN
jgi:hypothetical protein